MSSTEDSTEAGGAQAPGLGTVCISENGASPDDAYWTGRDAAGTVVDHRRLRRVPRVTVLPGGCVAKGYKGSNRAPVGGVRGAVTRFSVASRRRLRLKLMALDWQACDFSFVSLTYHNVYPERGPELKAALYSFMHRVEYKWPAVRGWVWRLEAQRRGAPHWHALLVWHKGKRIDAVKLELELKRMWQSAIGATGDLSHFLHGCHVVDGHIGRGEAVLIGYLCKELAKTGQNADGLPWGRLWGLRGAVPLVDGETLELTEDQWAAFCERVGRLPQAARSWYLQAIGPEWPGFVLVLDAGAVDGLLVGLPRAGP
jgi:hypothetical protein